MIKERKPRFGLLILWFFLGFGGIISKAQPFADSLQYSDLQSFEEIQSAHSFDNDRYVADTLYAHIVPGVDMETVEDRASCLQLDMPLVVNKTVCGFIHFFTVRKRNYTQTMLERKNYYFPIFEYYLKKHQMPDALKYLSIVESGLNFKAHSKAGAAGLWQFMPGTGTDFYLAQNQHIDERQNPYLATEAACKFLKYLYRTFGDWELALAAYNCGPGNVMKAMRRSGKRGFWEIYDFLPKETRSYVPQFHAVVYSMHYAKEHNIHPDIDSMLVTIPLDTFRIAKTFDLFKLENILGLPKQTLHHHNPTIRSGVYPSSCKHPLLVPQHISPILLANLDRYIDSAAVSEKARTVHAAIPEGKNLVYYQAHKGDRLNSIAAKHSVAVTSLKAWNHLSGDKLKKAKRLRIYVDEPLDKPEKEAVACLKDAAQQEAKTDENPDFHTVRKGEKLYQIAMRYSIPLADIRKFNNLSSSKINAGQKLYFTQQIVQDETLAVVAKKDSEESKIAISANPSQPQKYVVKKGEGLFQIAKANDATIAQLKDWNNLKSEKVRPGQELIVSFAANEVCDDSMQLAAAEPVKEVRSKLLKVKKQSEKHLVADFSKTYCVQKGDTLYSITKKFTKLSIKDLMKLNNLKNKNIKPGQQLIVG